MKNNSSPEEIATLATSISIALFNNFNREDIYLIKQLISSVCSLLNLMEVQCMSNKKSEGKK